MSDAVELQSVSKVFHSRPAFFNWIGKQRGGETRALVDVSLRAEGGEVLVILGPNGSGKTTLLKLVSTMLLPDRGSVCVSGYDTTQDSPEIRRHISYAVGSERSFYPKLTAAENLGFFAALEDVARRERQTRTAECLAAAGLEDSADTLVATFSTGMTQRLGIARALLKRPRVLLLDEPSRSLDPGASSQLWKLMREIAAAGTTVLLATHSFEEAAAVGDAVAILRSGRQLDHRRLGSREDAAQLRRYYFQEVEGTTEFQPGEVV